jgi:hypothetical protein
MARGEGANSRMKRKDYEKELRKLQVKLCELQEFVKAKKSVIVTPPTEVKGDHHRRRPHDLSIKT